MRKCTANKFSVLEDKTFIMSVAHRITFLLVNKPLSRSSMYFFPSQTKQKNTAIKTKMKKPGLVSRFKFLSLIVYNQLTYVNSNL